MKALITGATSGIGKAIAQEMSRRGISLILTGRNEEALLRMQETLPVHTEIIALDLAENQAPFTLYEFCRDKHVDILVNNAGFGVFGKFSETALQEELELLQVNVRALHILTKLFLADFRKRGSGRILNVASSAGFLAGPLMSGYYATKGYVLRLSEAISEELRQEGSRVTVTALCPGHVETNFDARAKVRRSIGGVSAKRVAQAGIEGMLRGKVVVLPGALMKMTYVGEKLLPESWMLKIAYRAQARKG